jgi:GPH family glycoside/pentoside/hexuronide:cation symporter
LITKTNVKPFGLRDKLGYLFGDLGNDFTFILSSSFLLKFYTDVMGVSAFIVGIVMMAARFVDAFTDVAMGRICDKSHVTKHGKFRPWIRRACAPVAISSFLIYQSGLASMPMAFKIVWLFVTYILWSSIFYTSINIPYGSMASALSAEPGDRQSLSTYRTLGGTLAGVVIGAGIPLLAFTKNPDGQFILNGGRFTLIAGIFSLLAVGAYLLCFALTTERVRFDEPKKREVYKLSAMLKNAFRNRALLSIIVASIVMLLAQLTLQSMAGYIYPNYYNSTAAQSASTLVMLGSMMLAATAAKPLAVKFGKAEISVAANAFAAAVSLLLFFWRPKNVWVFVAVSGVSWLGLGLFAMVSWALITDVIDYSEIKHGVREDGTTYALYSFARKLGQAAAAGLSGGLLSLIGYSDATQTLPSVLSGIYTISTIVPAIGFALLAIVLWFWYPLHKKQVDKNVEYLRKKREQNANE